MTTPAPMTGEPRPPAIITQFRAEAGRMESQFKAALPAHMPAERFVRVVMTAVQREPKLLACDRQSLFNACLQAANDGLLPDGREGVLLPFGSEDDDKVRDGAKVTWVPMVFGLRKKVRNAGVLADWNVQVVQEGDLFDYALGDEPYIKHKPAMHGGRTRPVIAAYSIAKYPDGTMSFEVMNIDQINDIRKLSRAKKGPWANPTFFPEMARKTVARLHSKQLPMSTDLDRVIHRDDPLYDFDAAREQARKIARPNTVAAALDYFGSGGEGEPPPGDTPPAKREGDGTKPDAKPEGNTGGAPGGGTGDGGLPLGDPPPKPAGPPTDAASYKTFARRVIDDVKGPDDALSLEAWFVSDAQKNMRSACGVGKADFEAVQGWVRDALDKHKPKK